METYVSIKKVTDYAINVLKYFAIASSMMLISIGGALLSWVFMNGITMTASIVGMVVSTVVITLGLYELYSQKSKGR